MGNTLLTLLSAEQIKHYYAAGHWRDDTIYSLVRDHARRTPQKPALRDRFRRVDYATLTEAADALAAHLAARGVKPGERVAVWLPSRIEGVIALLACSRNGYVCCPSLHRDHTTGGIIDLLRRTRAAAFIGQVGYGADADRRDIFAELAGVETLKQVYRLDAPNEAPSWPGLSRPSTSFPQHQQGVDARPSARDQDRPQPGRLSRLHLRHHRHAEGRHAQRQHAARQCARDRGGLGDRRRSRWSIR